jgi:hypothetical protein
MSGPGHFEAQSHAHDRGGHGKIKQGQSFGMSGVDPKGQTNLRGSFNNAGDRAQGSIVQATMGGHSQAASLVASGAPQARNP